MTTVAERESVPATAPFHVLCKPIGPLCNLRCEHCFYLQKKELYPDDERFRMSDETLERFVRGYIESQPPGTPEVNFAWQGGEPTIMGVDFFRRAVALQAQYARPGMAISNALQTNGTLLDEEWGAFLSEHDFLVGISIDGPTELHDHYRVDVRGRGSLEPALRGLRVLQQYGVAFNTLTCVQRHNARHAREIYRYLKALGAEHMQFIPIVEPAPDGKGVSDRTVHPSQFGRFLCEVFDEWRRADIGRIYVQHFEMMLGLVMGMPASLCVHARTCGRNVAMEHNGDVFACDHFVTREHQLGNLSTAEFAAMLDGEQAVSFGLDKRDGLPGQCRGCELLHFCNGGCPAHRLDTTAAGEPNLNYLCHGYQTFFRHSLPYFEAMAYCLRRGVTPAAYAEVMRGRQARPPAAGPAGAGAPRREPGRNAPCPCGSGRKYKACCARSRRR